MLMMARQLHDVRTTLAASQASAATPENHADVILQLSSAAQQLLLTTSR